MTTNEESFKGLDAPPLKDGKLCIDNYRKWMDDNEYWPHMMTYDAYRDHVMSKEKLSDKPLVRVSQLQIRLSMLNYWFYSIKQRILNGQYVSKIVLDDYYSREGYPSD